MIELELTQYLFLFILIFLSGFIDSIVGGGGLVTVPTYIMIGLQNHYVLGTNKCVSSIGTTLSIFRYLKNKKIFFRRLLASIILSFSGSLLGASVSHVLTNKFMVYIIVVLVPILVILDFIKRTRKNVNNDTKMFLIKSAFIGLTIGFYDGFFGPGTGTFFILALISILNFDILEASANARILNYSSNIAAFLYFSTQMKVAWSITPVAIVAALAGNYFGSSLVITGNKKFVTLLLYIVLIGLIGKIILF